MRMAEGDQDIVQDDKKLVQGHDYLEQDLEENLEQCSEQKLEQDLETFEQNSNEGLEQNLENDLDQVDVEQNISQDADQGNLVLNAKENFVQSLDQNLEQDSEQKAVQDLEIQQKPENKGNAIDGSGEKRWPGWPGESVFRMLVPVQKVGSIIGRKGEFIKKIVEETRARVKILDGPPGTMERAVMVSAKEEPDSSIPPAVDGLLRVHKRILDGLDNEASQAPPVTGTKVSTKMLVPASQAGSLIGKHGSNVKAIQESSNCVVRVLGTEELPIFALPDDRVVEVLGDATSVHKALELVASHLRKFLVDRSIIPVFETQMQMTNQRMNNIAPPQNWGPPQGFPPSAGGGHAFGSNPQYLPPPRQYDNFYPPVDMPPPMEKQPHQGISNYGREAPLSGHPSSTGQTTSSGLAQGTHQLQIPLSYADAVIGTAGANISYIRRVSGATVTIQETRGVPGEMTVEISGSASQVQTAEQLVQNFMAEAAAAAATQGQGGGSTDHNYNPYPAHGSAYASPPSNLGHSGHGGAYGSMYSSNYGY